MNKQILKYLMCLGIGLMSTALLADSKSFGDLANAAFTPTEIITKLMLVACYIIGAMLIFAALAQYKIHRQNPKFVPLTTPILLLILGIVCVLIPYTSKIWGESYSAVDTAEKKGLNNKSSGILLPDLNTKGPLLPVPTQPQQDDTPSSSYDSTPSEESPPQEETPGHWTQDPRYN